MSLAASSLGVIGLVRFYWSAMSGVPFWAALIVTAVFTIPRIVPPILMTMLWRATVRDSRHWLSPLAFSTIAAGVDVAFTLISGNGVLASWANSQFELKPALQVLALGGTPALTFLVTLPASAVAIALARGTALSRPQIAYALPSILLILGLSYGVARITAAPSSPQLRVGLIAGPMREPARLPNRREDPRSPAEVGGANDSVLRAYLQAATGLAQSGAQVIVMPEKIEMLDAAAAIKAKGILSAWAATHSTPMLIGFDLAVADRHENRAWLFDADGKIVADYAKQHLVTFEGLEFSAGRDRSLVKIGGHPVAIAICKDLDFPSLARDYAKSRIAGMLVPAWDFDLDAESHASMAVMRGVEQGFGVARAANHGLMTVSDAYGRILARRRAGTSTPETLIAEMPLGPVQTVYGRIGDTFGWVCVGIVVLTLALRRLWRRSSALSLTQ